MLPSLLMKKAHIRVVEPIVFPGFEFGKQFYLTHILAFEFEVPHYEMQGSDGSRYWGHDTD